MSLTPDYTPPSNTVSKVTFSPVSDGKTDALIVTIKTVVPEGDENSAVVETLKRSIPTDAKRKTRSSRTTSNKSVSQPLNKATMTKKSEGVPFASQTSVEPPTASAPDPEHAKSLPGSSDSSPCLKHAAQNISRKASDIPSEKFSLCNNCSKSMLSYIFLVQDFLDSLAKEICGNADSKNCVQCLRQEIRNSISASGDETPSAKTSSGDSKHSKRLESARDDHKSESSRHGDTSKASKKTSRSKETQREVRKYEETAETLIQRSISQHQERASSQHHQTDYTESTPQSSMTQHEKGKEHLEHNFPQHQNQQYSSPQTGPVNEGSQPSENIHQDGSTAQLPHVQQNQPPASYHEVPSSTYHSGPQPSPQQDFVFRSLMERQQPDFREGSNGNDQSGFRCDQTVSSPQSQGVDGIVTTLSNLERQVYDSARNGAGWESLAESQERSMSSSSDQIPSEAFVTMCRNNAEALGCLVVGTSLLLTRTSRTLCVLVSDGVSNAFRGPLSSIFQVVQCVRAMDSLGTTKLALLEQPELGISFEKLNVWRLVQFNKCVYLNPDTLVLQNCDELFCRNELSAVPDIGWPDCFNSGVFVFVPSMQTFWQLLEFAEKQGSYDGGDQGLLNSYFKSWPDDINKKLSFIYNLMANVSYTYTPAYKKFGREVKIVQFHGSFKPWHVKYFSRTGQISPSSSVHPTYVQFVHIWLNIFRINGLRQLSQEIQSYAMSQEVICAVELLRFFPLPSESEAEFYLTPPSIRLRLAERKFQKTLKLQAEAQRRKSADFPRGSARFEDEPPSVGATTHTDADETSATVPDICITSSEASITPSEAAESGGAASGTETKAIVDENALPGAEVGNYQGMKAWEQGRMDYQGTDSSEVILKRLQFLMDQSK